jgi:hypothetical protein
MSTEIHRENEKVLQKHSMDLKEPIVKTQKYKLLYLCRRITVPKNFIHTNNETYLKLFSPRRI